LPAECHGAGMDAIPPSFENLTPAILALLRGALEGGGGRGGGVSSGVEGAGDAGGFVPKLERRVAIAWAEELLRGCEAGTGGCGARLRAKWGGAAAANGAALAEFFLEFYVFSCDFRFLNLLLKMADMWHPRLPAVLRARIEREARRVERSGR